jgi:hypothetical protein
VTRWLVLAATIALAGCGSVQPVTTVARSGEVTQVPVGSPMVSHRSTTVVVKPVAQSSRVDGLRVEFVYLGLLGSDPAGKNTIRVRYEEHRIANGLEEERPSLRAEVTLDLSRSRVIEYKGWRIGVLDATDSSIRCEVVGSPAR